MNWRLLSFSTVLLSILVLLLILDTLLLVLVWFGWVA